MRISFNGRQQEEDDFANGAASQTKSLQPTYFLSPPLVNPPQQSSTLLQRSLPVW
jgi:hypothetical protein